MKELERERGNERVKRKSGKYELADAPSISLLCQLILSVLGKCKLELTSIFQ